MEESCNEGSYIEMTDPAGIVRLSNHIIYKPGLNCTLIVSAPTGHQVAFYFTVLSIKANQSGHCGTDYVDLYDGVGISANKTAGKIYIQLYDQ